MNQRVLPLYHTVTQVQVYNAWLNNGEVNSVSSWAEVVRDELIFGCLAREAAYTNRGQHPQQLPQEELAMSRNVVVLDMAEARQVRLALALCRERIACPATTTVNQEEAIRELRAAQEMMIEHEERAMQLRNLNSELEGSRHA